MAKASRDSAPQRTWRAQRATGKAPGEKNAGRIIFSLLTLGLLGLLGWYVVSWLFLPRIYFAGIPVVDHGALELAPIPFALEDAEAFSRWAPDESEDGVIWRSTQTTKLLSNLSDRLRGTVKRNKDVLVFYVWAQGISSEGKAYLLCGGSNHTRADEQRYPMIDLLRQLKDCPGRLKLLILDTGHIGCDPRLGMVVNEFPQLLQEDLKKIDDPGLWVLTAAGPLQTSHVSYASRRSVFGSYVVEGLRGTADHNENRIVDLNELYRFTRNHVAEWVLMDTDDVEIQTPRLLRAGGYPVDLDDTPDLLPVARSKARASSQGKEGRKERDAKASEGKGENVPREQVRKLLTEAWNFRDKMQRRGADLPWSPVDYAPHDWRAYQELLLGYEARFRAGVAFQMDSLRDDLKKILSADEKRPFRGKADNEIGFDQSEEDGDTIRAVIQLKNDLLFRAPYYVRWMIRYSQSRGTRHPLHEDVVRLLEELKRYVGALERLQSLAAAGAAYDDLRQDLQRLHEFQTSDGDEKLEDLDLQIQQRLAEEVDGAKTKGDAGQIEALLCTPLLSGSQRDALIRRLEKLPQTPLSPRKTWYGDDHQSKTQELAARQWQCVADRNELHGLLHALATLSSDTASSDAASAGVKDDRWEEYRNRGTMLRTFYATTLPSSINRGIGDGQTTDTPPLKLKDRLRVDRHLRLLDARDALPIDAPDLTECTIRMPIRPEDSLVLGRPAETVVLDRKIPTSFALTLSTNNKSLRQIQVRFDYPELRLSVKDSKGRPARRGSWMPVELDGAGKATATFWALPLGPGEAEIPMTVFAQAGESTDKRETGEITFRRAAPDVVDLLIHRIDGISEPPVDKTSARSYEEYDVRPFPNRTTAYRFDLVNRSDDDKEVEVYLLAVPKLDIDETLAPEHLVTDGMPNSQVRKLLAKPIKMTLPKRGKPEPILFPASKVEEEPSEAEDATSDPPSGDDVTQGLACLIRETSPKKRFWLKILDLEPRPPRTYLQPKVTYDPLSGKLNVAVGPIEDEQGLRKDLLPALSAENELPLKMEVMQRTDLPGNKLSARMTRTARTVNLFVHTTARPDQVVRVHLSADGYPRAFVYLVECHPDTSPNMPAEPERSLREVRILLPEDSAAFKVPPPQDPLLYFTFQVDAPEVAFLDPGDKERVEVRILDARMLDSDRLVAQEKKREEEDSDSWCEFPRDRQVSVSLLPPEPEGVVRFKTEVTDFKIPLPYRDVEDRDVLLLQAKLFLKSQGPGEEPEDSVGILLDGEPPQFKIIEPAGPVIQGQPIRVAVKLDGKDLAGVREISFALHSQEKPDAGEKLAFKPGTMTSDQVYATTLPAADSGKYYLHVKATDNVNNSFQDVRRVDVKDESTANGSTAVVEPKGSIHGRVTQGDQAADDMTVTLEGLDSPPPAKTGKDGRYSFEDLKPGEYTIHAEGYPHGGLVVGSRKVTVKAGKKANGDIAAK